MKRRSIALGILGLAFALLISACGTARHIAIVADLSFNQAVFAIDDAERAACAKNVLSAVQCDAANVQIKQALTDVVAVSSALKASPKSLSVPKTLPNLIGDLTGLQGVVANMTGGPVKDALLVKITVALDQAIAILKAFATTGSSS